MRLAMAMIVVFAGATVFGVDVKPKRSVGKFHAATPKDAAVAFMKAMVGADKAAMLAVCKGSKKELDVVAAIADVGRVAMDFKTAFVKAYGEQAWKDFQDPAKGPKEGNASLNLPSAKAVADIAKMKFEIKDGKAECQVPNAPTPLVLVKSGDGWFVDAASLLPPGAQPEAFVKMMRSLAAELAKYKKAIGKKGISGEDIDAELGRAFAKALMGISTPQPHRFDIDKIK